MYFHFLCVLQSAEAFFFISLSDFPILSIPKNTEEHLIALDSSLVGQNLLQNLKMSFIDFLTILLQNAVLEWNTVVIFKDYQFGMLKIVKNHIYSIVPTFQGQRGFYDCLICLA